MGSGIQQVQEERYQSLPTLKAARRSKEEIELDEEERKRDLALLQVTSV